MRCNRRTLPEMFHKARTARDFNACERAAVAMEFAILVPVMFTVLMACFEIQHAIDACKRLNSVVTSIADLVSQNAGATLSANDANTFLSSSTLIFPAMLTDAMRKNTQWNSLLGVDILYISFTATPAGCVNYSTCTYTPKLSWFIKYDSAGLITAPACGQTFTPSASDLDTPAVNRLPSNAYGPNPVIMVLAKYAYPTFLQMRFVGSFTITRAAFEAPRYVSALGLDSANLAAYGNAAICP